MGAAGPLAACRLCASLAFPAFAVNVFAADPCLAHIAGARSVESERYVLAYRTQPEQIRVGVHFSVAVSVCVKGGAPAPESMRVDAHMPEHRHGMNYRTVVERADEGRYHAEGLMFHMPGRWEYVFELRAGGFTDRVTDSIVLD